MAVRARASWKSAANAPSSSSGTRLALPPCPMSPTSRPTPWEQDSPAGWGRGAGWLADSDLQTKCAQVSPAPAAAPRLRFRVPASPGSAHLPATHSFTHHCDHPPPSPSRSPSSLCPSGNRSALCPQPPAPAQLAVAKAQAHFCATVPGGKGPAAPSLKTLLCGPAHQPP